MAAPNETPIVVKIHYDSNLGQYRIKASRQEKSDRGFEYQELIETAYSLLALIQLLLQWWAIAGGTPGAATRNAPAEDLAAFQAELSAWTMMAVEQPALPVAHEILGPPDPESMPTYDGEADAWGVPH